MNKNTIANFVRQIVILFVSNYIRIAPKSVRYISLKEPFEKKSNSVLLVLGYGWNVLDSALPLLTWLKEREECNIYVLFPFLNARRIKEAEYDRFKFLYEICDGLWMNSFYNISNKKKAFKARFIPRFVQTLLEIIDISVCETIDSTDYWKKTLANILENIHFNSVIMYQDTELVNVFLFLKGICADSTFISMYPNCYPSCITPADICDCPCSFDYFIATVKSIYTASDAKSVRKIIIGSPRLDSWWISKRVNSIDVDNLKKGLNPDKKTVLCLFCNVCSRPRIDLPDIEGFSYFLNKSSSYNFVFKFHPRNSESERKMFTRKCVPNDVSFIETSLETIQCAAVSDVVIAVGASTVVGDILSTGVPIISFYDSANPIREVVYQEGWFFKSDEYRYFSLYDLHKFICHADTGTELEEAVHELLFENGWESYKDKWKDFFSVVDDSCQKISNIILNK